MTPPEPPHRWGAYWSHQRALRALTDAALLLYRQVEAMTPPKETAK